MVIDGFLPEAFELALVALERFRVVEVDHFVDVPAFLPAHRRAESAYSGGYIRGVRPEV